DPVAEVLGVVREDPGADHRPRGEVREVRADLAARVRSPDLMAARAGLVHEDPRASGRTHAGRRFFVREPRPEALPRLGDDAELHVRVLEPAELGALPG